MTFPRVIRLLGWPDEEERRASPAPLTSEHNCIDQEIPLDGRNQPVVGHRRYDGENWIEAIKLKLRKRAYEPRLQLSVRRDWPDGTHDLRGTFSSEREAAHWLVADSDSLRTAAAEAVYSVVPVTEQQLRRHQNMSRCSSPHCPAPARPSGWEFRGDL
jgi:hypothetical protein